MVERDALREYGFVVDADDAPRFPLPTAQASRRRCCAGVLDFGAFLAARRILFPTRFPTLSLV